MKSVDVLAAFPPDGGEEYLSIAETATRVCLSAKRIRNLMSAGVLKEGYHFFRPAGIGPRFKWSRVVEWLEGSGKADAAIPMARQRRTGVSVDRGPRV